MSVQAYQPYAPTTAYQPSYAPTTSYSPVAPASTDSPQAFNADFSKISSIVAHTAGTGFTTYKLIAKGGGIQPGFKGALMTGLKGAGLSGLISAGVSAAANGIGVATGKVDKTVAVNNVISDTLTGTVGGLGAVAVGGLGSKLLGSFMQGTPLMIATVALGAVGGTLAAQFTKGAIDKGQTEGSSLMNTIGGWFGN